MSSSQQADYIIIGQGLAGSCLALQLTYRSKKVIVFDQPASNHSTSVAAGLFNPITGKMLAKTWQADMLFPYMYAFYQNAERYFNRKFFYRQELYRPFGSVEEQNEWMGRSTHGAMKEYIADIFLKSTFGHEVKDPVGGVLLRHGGYVDTAVFTEAVRAMLISTASYRDERWEESELQEQEGGVAYKNLTAKKVIYCGGVADLQSRFFSGVPIKPLKGETLQIRTGQLERIYNRGVYIVPGNHPGEYKVGATYDYLLTEEITPAGRNELEMKLSELLKLPYEVTHQKWGIRPTTHDRRVILGPHPASKNVIIFNGLGTKGVSLAPYFSGQLAAWLEGEVEIPREVNIGRFKSLYSKFQ